MRKTSRRRKAKPKRGKRRDPWRAGGKGAMPVNRRVLHRKKVAAQVKGCARKKPYKYEEALEVACTRLNSTPGLSELHVYVCPDCSHYHMSKTTGPSTVATVFRENEDGA